MDKEYPLFQESWNYFSNGLDGYSKFFPKASNSKFKIKLEATADYIYQKTPIKVLPTLKKVPKIIFVLRKPEERVFSLYNFAKNNMAAIDKSVSFSEMVENIRMNNGSAFQKKNQIIVKNAIEHSRYSKYIEKWIGALGRDSFCVLKFDELVMSPHVNLEIVCTFLGINPDFYHNFDFQIKNQSFKVRNQWLHKLKRKYKNKIPFFGLRKIGKSFYDFINIDTSSRSRTEEEIKVLQMLKTELLNENRRLEKLLDMDFSSWDI